jgi:hypothetical protein
MKYILFFFLIGSSTVLRNARTTRPPLLSIIECSPSDAGPVKEANGRFIPALSGWGSHAYIISTKQDSAQFFFNQGINLYYSYHLRESQASFMEAARFDSSCAMVYWGEALAMGPYFNSYTYKMKPGVPAVLATMNRHSSGASPRELRLMKALQKRYSSDLTNADRVQLDKSYALALSDLVKQYPADDDIKALYIDAVMLEHKWDFWYTDGTAKPWTPELITLCEGVLKRNPHHPAALHYYIHLTEASWRPERALPYAELLKDEMPGVGHMVHMATHSYQRNGLYAKGVLINEESNTAYNREDSLAPALGIGQNNVLHIYAVQSFCAMNAGLYARGMPIYLRARDRCIAANPAFEQDPLAQFMIMLPELASVRMGKWEDIRHAAAPDPRWKYAAVLYHFARGMANVRGNDLPAARADVDSIQQNLGDSLLNIRMLPFDKPAQCGAIAAGILRSEILIKENRLDLAVTTLKHATAAEDSLIYREPQQWLIPVRHYLGACLLKANKAVEAEKVYRSDLVRNPGNGWSLLGLCQSLTMQHRSKEAAAVRAKYLKAFAAADVIPPASVF